MVWRTALVVLRGVGQVMFQGHAGTGVLFLAGIALASPLMLAGAVIGAVIGTVVAKVARYDEGEFDQGIYGFNPVLVGIGTLFYLQPRPLTWILLVAGCVVSTVLTHLARRHLSFPTYTAPFIVVTWAVIIIAHAAAGTGIDVKPAPAPETPAGFLTAVLAGPAEVMFGATVLTGLLFLIGVAISDWRHAALALIGSLVGTALAVYHNNPVGTISLGLYGYNASLAAMAVYLWRKSLLIPLLAAAISIPLTEFFPSQLGIPPLTAPFVAAAWIVILIGQLEAVFIKEPATP
ncbi:urea transporter [Ramlibacter tataouinensis]|uniref:Urea transporter n=1 Tax=Ramlibacter tataouinensis TaxID=94132 RepID=A0A127JZY4_9BURK|nr:urea transporter [Ramlibacter tataouinensis]AMO25489.1 urea transporter [Ramlibacter tataouinensis]